MMGQIVAERKEKGVLKTAPKPKGVPALLAEDHPRVRTALVSLLEVPKAERAAAVARTIEMLSENGENPVFLTDDLDFSVFSGEGHYYEYLPSLAEQQRHAPGRRWDLYIVQKLRIMIAKWQPVRIMTKGTSLEDFVAKIEAAHVTR
jgi:hypothetical protein